MDNLTFMPAAQEDIPALAALCAGAPDPWRQEDFLPELKKSETLLLVAKKADVCAGFACFWKEEDVADLALVAVARSFRQKGIGEGLLTEAFCRLKKDGVNRVVLEVRCSNKAALALYKKLGFVNLACRRGLYAAPAEDGFCLQKQL